MKSEDKQSLSWSIRQIVQELQWTNPGIRFGVVADPNNASFVNATCGSRAAIRFQSSDDIYEPLHLLDWLCGVDAWLTLEASPLANAFQKLAADLRIPCFSLSPRSTLATKNHWHETACAIEKALELRFNGQATLAFRTPDHREGQHRGLTGESALEILQSALRQTNVPTSSLEVFPSKMQLRPAA